MDNEVKMGLTEEDVRRRGEGPGIAGLLQAMGDSAADPQAIAQSQDGRLIEERMSVMGMGRTPPRAGNTGPITKRACASRSTERVWTSGPASSRWPLSVSRTADSPWSSACTGPTTPFSSRRATA